jgi:predicted amidohydrolase YtcJ
MADAECAVAAGRAYANFLDDESGSLEVGKRADP